MHEFSVAAEIARVVRDSARERGVKSITDVYVTVGELSCVYPEALRAAFSAVRREHPTMSDAELHIRRQGIVARCRSCGTEREIDDHEFVCAECGSAKMEVTAGEDLSIDEYSGRGSVAEGDET